MEYLEYAASRPCGPRDREPDGSGDLEIPIEESVAVRRGPGVKTCLRRSAPGGTGSTSPSDTPNIRVVT